MSTPSCVLSSTIIIFCVLLLFGDFVDAGIQEGTSTLIGTNFPEHAEDLATHFHRQLARIRATF
jgi:archaellum component FlaG (FlaF/FlaG flagellin family)